MSGCMYVGTARPPLRNWIISSARSMAPQWSQWPWERTMPSTLPMSKPRRSTLRSNTQSSGPVSNSKVCAVLPLQAVMAQDKPWAPQHKQPPEILRRPLFQSRVNSFSTYFGTEERLSVTLSTSTRISTLSAAASSGMWRPWLGCANGFAAQAKLRTWGIRVDRRGGPHNHLRTLDWYSANAGPKSFESTFSSGVIWNRPM